KRGPAPHFQREQTGMAHRVSGSDAEHVERAHARRQQRLVSVAKGRVRHQQTLLVTNPLGKSLRPQFQEFVARASGDNRGLRIENRGWRIVQAWDWCRDIGLRRRSGAAWSLAAKFGVAIDDDVREIR